MHAILMSVYRASLLSAEPLLPSTVSATNNTNTTWTSCLLLTTRIFCLWRWIHCLPLFQFFHILGSSKWQWSPEGADMCVTLVKYPSGPAAQHFYQQWIPNQVMIVCYMDNNINILTEIKTAGSDSPTVHTGCIHCCSLCCSLAITPTAGCIMTPFSTAAGYVFNCQALSRKEHPERPAIEFIVFISTDESPAVAQRGPSTHLHICVWQLVIKKKISIE